MIDTMELRQQQYQKLSTFPVLLSATLMEGHDDFRDACNSLKPAESEIVMLKLIDIRRLILLLKDWRIFWN